MKSNLRYTVDFKHRFTGEHRTAVVDLCDLTGDEIRDALHGPAGVFGPRGWAHAYRHAVAKMSAEFVGMPETVRAFRVQ